MKRKGGSKAQSPVDRISLNPDREASDERDAEQILSDPSLKEAIEACWFCVLHNGDSLRKQQCDVPRFRLLVEASGLCATDRHMNAALRQFGLHVMDDEDRLDIRGFVKCLTHIACDRFPAFVGDKPGAVRKLLEAHFTPFVTRYRAANAHDGTGSDDTLLTIPEIDRLLYINDAVFERLFLRYRDVDHHQTRELTLEQVKILDQFMELEEMKEFLKDFGFFPKLVSFVEVSKAGQWASFGRLVMDPTKQGGGRVSNIETAKKDAGGTVGINVAGTGESPTTNTEDGGVSNALFIPQLPAEYQTSEVLLDKPRFMSCVLRIAQMIFSKPEHQKTLPSIVSRAEEFLLQVAPMYERMFHRTMESDCDYSEKGVPLLNNIAPSAALQPDGGPLSGGIDITIIGSNFCEKRGVFVRFGSSGAVVVRAKTIAKKKIVVDAPAMQPDDVEVDVDFQHGQYVMKVTKTAKVAVECSNNRWQFSDTDPAQYFTFRGAPRFWSFGEELSAQLMKLFGAVCALTEINGVAVAGGGSGSSNKLMNRERWKELKRMTGLSESVVASRGGGGGGQKHPASSANDGKAKEEDNDVYFLELAEYHDADHDLSLNFKAFLRAVTRTLYEMHGEEGWRPFVDELAATQLGVQRRVVQPGPVLEQNEIVLARRAIGMVERRSILELDVYMGPVLCGVLRSRPGDVTSSYSGQPVVHVRGHSFLAYDQIEMNTETCVLRHLQMAHSIPHFILRLRKDGFDFASRHPRPKTRKPAGRCWALSLESAPEKQLGVIWDYEGNYSSLEWQPAEKEMFHPQITMTIYEDERSTHFVACYLLFQKSSSVQHLRTQLETKGYILKTKLYRVP